MVCGGGNSARQRDCKSVSFPTQTRTVRVGFMEKVRFEHRLEGSKRVSPGRGAATAKALIGSMSVTFPHPLACWRNSMKQGRQAIRSDGACKAIIIELGFYSEMDASYWGV